MFHARLLLRYPFAVLGAAACFVATHRWACRSVITHEPHIRSEEL